MSARGRMLLVSNREAFRGGRITSLVLPAGCCLRRGATLRIAAALTPADRTENRLDAMDSRRDQGVMVVPATVADRLTAVRVEDLPTVVATQGAALRRQAGENRHRVVLAVVDPTVAAAVHRARTEVRAGAADIVVVVGITDIAELFS
jgi:hypothetical protein